MRPFRYLAPSASSYPKTRHHNPEKCCLVLTSEFQGYYGQMTVFTRCETVHRCGMVNRKRGGRKHCSVVLLRLEQICEWTWSGGLHLLLLTSVIFFLMPRCDSLYFHVTTRKFLYSHINQRQPGRSSDSMYIYYAIAVEILAAFTLCSTALSETLYPSDS
jgi:hypothetical protein